MAEMADYFLESVIEEEYQRDLYVSGRMDIHEAYDRGFLDSTGSEQGLEDAWSRNSIPTQDYLDNELKDALKDLELSSCIVNNNEQTFTPKHSDSTTIDTLEKLGYKVLKIDNDSVTILNKEATHNLNHDVPTCNCCSEFMTPQDGKFGKFYFCGNYCKGQKTVSDKYWQSVRRVNK